MQLITADTPETQFPSPNSASEEGLVAVGGEITTRRVLSAYRQGIFPWYSEDQPVLWWSPEPRAILYPDGIKISRSLKKTLRHSNFSITADKAFSEVIKACAGPRTRSPTGGTWITTEMMDAYNRLHQLGYGHSIEVWDEEKLVGGLYGLSLGSAFFGESMFSHKTDASKLALVSLAKFSKFSGIDFIDCQLPTNHLASMGAINISRKQYLRILETALRHQDQTKLWQLED
ncbi:MAG: leucyl/phenylalanyl-tRNA--protein transferase [Arenicellales bacterium]